MNKIKSKNLQTIFKILILPLSKISNILQNLNLCSFSLFKSVDTSLFRKPTYEALLKLEDNFEPRTGVAEVDTPEVFYK